jgi:hypothetical protein
MKISHDMDLNQLAALMGNFINTECAQQMRDLLLEVTASRPGHWTDTDDMPVSVWDDAVLAVTEYRVQVMHCKLILNEKLEARA